MLVIVESFGFLGLKRGLRTIHVAFFLNLNVVRFYARLLNVGDFGLQGGVASVSE